MILTSSSPPSSSLSFFFRSIGGGTKLVIWMQSSRKYSETDQGSFNALQGEPGSCWTFWDSPWTGKVRPNTSMMGELKKYSLNMVVSMVADMRTMRTSGKAWTTSLRTTRRKSVCRSRDTVRNLRAEPPSASRCENSR